MNLVDNARALIQRHQCDRCGVALHPVLSGFIDGAGGRYCRDGFTFHAPMEISPPAPVIVPSPTLAWRR